MNLEDLRLNVDVTSSDGHKLGNVSRFVFDTESGRLTHLVIDTGIFRSGEALWKGGWGMSHDRVVPFGVVASVTSDDVRITMSADEFKELSTDYQEEYFVRVPDERPGSPDASDLQRLVMSIPGEPGPYLLRQAIALRPHEAQISNDSPVWRLNPHEKVGEVERVIYDDDSGRVRSLVVRRGFVFTKDVTLPMDYVVEVVGDIVRIDIDEEALNALPEHQPSD